MYEVLTKFLAEHAHKNLDENGDLKPGGHWPNPDTIPYDTNS
jgi:hypothetical protein